MHGLPFSMGSSLLSYRPSCRAFLACSLLPFFMGVRRSCLRSLFFSIFHAPVGRLFGRPLLSSGTPWPAFLPPDLFFTLRGLTVTSPASLPPYLCLAPSCRLGCGLLSLAFWFPTGRFLGHPVRVSPPWPLSMPPSWPLDTTVPWPLYGPPPWPRGVPPA